MKKIIYSLIGLGFVLNFNSAYGMTSSSDARLNRTLSSGQRLIGNGDELEKNYSQASTDQIELSDYSDYLTQQLKYTKEWIDYYARILSSWQTAYEEAKTEDERANINKEIEAINTYLQKSKHHEEFLEERIQKYNKALETPDPKEIHDLNTNRKLYDTVLQSDNTEILIKDYERSLSMWQTAYREAKTEDEKAEIAEYIKSTDDYVKELKKYQKSLEDLIERYQDSLTENSL